MELETILNAMNFAQARSIKGSILHTLDPYSAAHINLPKLDRQYDAFRARILRMDAVGKSINADLWFEIDLLENEIVKKDAEIAYSRQRLHELTGGRK